MTRVLETYLVIYFQQATQPLVLKRASHVSLPHIGSPTAGLKTAMSMEKYPVIIHEPTAIRTARRVSVLPQGESHIKSVLPQGESHIKSVLPRGNPI